MKVGYYPGCSLHSTAQNYDLTTRQVCQRLGLELEEIPDWNCCGSTPAHCEDHILSISLSARNLVLAEEKGYQELLAPCAACFNHLKAATVELSENPDLAAFISSQTNLQYNGGVKVRNVLDLLTNVIGLQEIQKKVSKFLKGLRVAPYYGCLLTRPNRITQFDHPTNPQSMDILLDTLGAEVVPWGAKTDCCGASYSLTKTEVVLKLSGQILQQAQKNGADVIVTACPLCQANLDLRQRAIENQNKKRLGIPIVYITELLAISLGVSAQQIPLHRRLVDVKTTLRRKQII